MPDVVVYSRKNCHLCDEMKQALTRLQRHTTFRWREVDIDADPELQRLYNEEVPVLFIGDKKAFKYRIDEREFLRRIAR